MNIFFRLGFLFVIPFFCVPRSINNNNVLNKLPIKDKNTQNNKIFPKIVQNKILSVQIVKNQVLDNNKKLLELILVKPGNKLDKDMIDVCAKQVREAYKVMYPSSSVMVKPYIRHVRQNLFSLVFEVTIKELSISKIIVRGNELIDGKKIGLLLKRNPSSWIFPYFYRSVVDLNQLDNSSELIKKYANSIGFFDFKINSIHAEVLNDNKPDSIAIVIEIDEGKRYKFDSITCKNETGLQEIEKIVKSIKTGSTYDLSKIEHVLRDINSFLVKKNLTNYEISVDQSKSRDKSVSIEFKIIESKNLAIIDSINLKGNFSIPDSVVLKKVYLSAGDPLSFEAIKRQQKILMDTSLFKNVVIDPIIFENKAVLFMSVEENQTQYNFGGKIKTEDFGLEASAKIPSFLGSGSVFSASAYLSRNPSMELSIFESNVYGLGVDITGEIAFHRYSKPKSMFGYPETPGELLQYLFNDNWHPNVNNFIKNIKSFVDQDSKKEEFKISRNIVNNWKENYFIDNIENLFRSRFNLTIPGENSFSLSLFGNIRKLDYQYSEIPGHLSEELLQESKNKNNKLTYDQLSKILSRNTEQESKSIRLFKEMLLKQKNELGLIAKYVSSNSLPETNYSYGIEVCGITGTTSAMKSNIFGFLSKSFGEYGAIEFEALAGLAVCNSFLDNFNSDIPGLRYGPIEMYRFTFIGGRKIAKFATYFIFPMFSSDYFSFVLRPGISFNSIWDSGIEKNRLPEALSTKRGWSKNSLDVAMNDFNLLTISSLSAIIKFNGIIFSSFGSSFLSIDLNKPITKNPFIRYSPIDISFGFSNN